MKKLYTYLSVLIVLCGTLSTQAQTCASTKAFPFKYEGSCFVFIRDAIVNADIHVYDGATRINTSESRTDASGEGKVFFDCSKTITSVILTKADGTVCNVAFIAETFEAPPGTLPVKLSSFSAGIKNNAAELVWVSSMEKETSHFVLQRSTDGKTYVDVSNIAAQGNSNLFVSYKYSDAQLGNTSVFYRLKMVDIDGKFDFSKVVYVNNKKGTTSGTLSVFPNPFRSDIQLTGVAAADVNKQNIRVFDVAGKQIDFVITGSNAITVDANAPRGIYILRVKEQSFKLVKE